MQCHPKQQFFPAILFTILLITIASIMSIASANQTQTSAGPPVRSTFYDGTSKARVDHSGTLLADDILPMTIEAWIYRSDDSKVCQAIVSHGSSSFSLRYCSGLRFSRSGEDEAVSITDIHPEEWTHIAVSYNGIHTRFYINGKYIGQTNLEHGVIDKFWPLYIGYDPNTINFHGYIDELRIWSLARSETEIQGGMYEEIRTGKGLVATFGNGGDFEDLSNQTTYSGEGAIKNVFGILPRDLVVPLAVGEPIMDGSIDRGLEYAGAEQLVIRYMYGEAIADAVAYLVHTEDDLFVGIRPHAARWTDSPISLYMDTNHSRHILAGSNDVRIRVPLNDDSPTWSVGNGMGFYGPPSTPPPAGSWEVVKDDCGNEFDPPCVEIRIARSQLGDWSEIDGLALAHWNLVEPSGDFMAPSDAVAAAPISWPEVHYSSQSADLPSVRLSGHVMNDSAGANDPINMHMVHLGTDSGWYYSRATDVHGAFSFNVPILQDVPIRLMIAECPSCNYAEPVIDNTGIGPSSVSPRTVEFPGCSQSSCRYSSVDFRVLEPVGTPNIDLAFPNSGAPAILLRRNPELYSQPDQVRLFGQNLHPYIEVYLLDTVSADCQLLPPPDSCYYEVNILTDTIPEDWTSVDVILPSLTHPMMFGDETWRWVLRDAWDWSVTQTTEGFFDIQPPDYTTMWGFGFHNTDDEATIDEFLAVYKDNAYICIGFNPLGLCLTYAPDPVYWLTWLPVFTAWVDGTGGSCTGMSATSLLIANQYIGTDDFDDDVYYPAGFTSAGKPSAWDYGDLGHPAYVWPDPIDLWAEVRMNHGVQTSYEFISHSILQTTANGLSFGGNPLERLDQIRDDPSEYVICMTRDVGSGHCVSPYEVVDIDENTSRILIYDNSEPGDINRFIEIDHEDNTYTFPRPDRGETWTGTAIQTIPLSVWRSPRQAPLNLVDLMVSGIFGDADGMFTTPEGGRWGWEVEGTLVDDLPGAVVLTPWQGTRTKGSNVAVALPTNTGSYTIEVHSKGEEYQFFTANGGQIFQLVAEGSKIGNTDQIDLSIEGNQINAMRFTPENNAMNFTPRIGNAKVVGERSVFSWQDLAILGGGSLNFESLNGKSVAYQNDSGQVTSHTLFIHSVEEAGGTTDTSLFGPFNIPQGASHRTTVIESPNGSRLLSEVDLDRDGTPDESEVVVGKPCQPLDTNGDAAPDRCQSFMAWIPVVEG